ncbi:hypothetical protein ACTJKN_15735 [Pedobacter sp. 22163]|uniref:hypothetical protein n=1 Tax=Pedobacter sp. 22163 TaxID=3453883 RepID=UPI003F84211F
MRKKYDDRGQNSTMSEKCEDEQIQTGEIELLKKLLFRIWGVTEILQCDVGFLKKLYTTPKRSKKQDTNREDRKASVKHKLLTRKRKLD